AARHPRPARRGGSQGSSLGSEKTPWRRRSARNAWRAVSFVSCRYSGIAASRIRPCAATSATSRAPYWASMRRAIAASWRSIAAHLSSRVGHRHVGHLRRDDDPIVEWTRENRGQQGVAREQQRLYLAEPDEDGVGGTHRRILSARLTLPDGGTSSIIMVAVWSNCYASYQGETEWTFTLYCDQGGAPQHTRRVSSGAAEAPSRERS